ncbi:unknown [Bacteroides sp. CAG:443]|nr:unknown [Bacteroides sp. CAG:443]
MRIYPKQVGLFLSVYLLLVTGSLLMHSGVSACSYDSIYFGCIKKGCRKGNLFSKDMKDSLFLFLVLLRLTFTFWVIVFSHTFWFWQQYLV